MTISQHELAIRQMPQKSAAWQEDGLGQADRRNDPSFPEQLSVTQPLRDAG